MAQQTAVEWLHENNKVIAQMLLDNKISQSIIDQLFNCFVINLEQAKEMEKEKLNIARLDGINLANKGYGSKGSDGNFKQFSLYEHKETITSADIKKAETMGLYDKIELTNPNDSIFTSSQTEISDEEIEKAANEHLIFWRGKNFHLTNPIHADRTINDFKAAIKWYREQLKNVPYGVQN